LLDVLFKIVVLISSCSFGTNCPLASNLYVANPRSKQKRNEKATAYVTSRPLITMGVRSYFKRPRDVVEFHETMTSPQKSAPTLQHNPDSIISVASVAPLFEPEVLLSKEDIRRKVEDMRSNYIKAVDTGLPPPITISEVAVAQPLTTAKPNTPSLARSLSAYENGVTTISRPSSADSENDNQGQTTPFVSNRASIYPAGDFRNSSMPDINDMKAEIMCNYLHQQQLKKMWSNGGREEGVLLKKSRGEYTSCPSDLQLRRNGLFDAVKRLNVRVCGYTQPG
jgi:hypothetical protein